MRSEVRKKERCGGECRTFFLVFCLKEEEGRSGFIHAPPCPPPAPLSPPSSLFPPSHNSNSSSSSSLSLSLNHTIFLSFLYNIPPPYIIQHSSFLLFLSPPPPHIIHHSSFPPPPCIIQHFSLPLPLPPASTH